MKAACIDREATKGVAMREAGHIRGSRVYAVGPDPFACSRRVRAAALARFGLDFDDEASFPRAGAHLIKDLILSPGSTAVQQVQQYSQYSSTVSTAYTGR